MGLLIELLAIAGIFVFSFILLTVILPKMKKEMKNFTWDQYFKQCGIYQGTSHWTTIKTLLLKLNK